MASITRREQEILDYIIENPFITQSEIASRTGITRSSVAVHIRNMTTKGFIKGRAYILPNDYYTLCIGGASLGFYGTLDGNLEYGGRRGMFSYGHDGAARNVAEILKQLDMKPELLTAFSGDEGGKELIDGLNELKIPFTHSIRNSEMPTSREMCLLSPYTAQYTAVMDSKILSLLSPDYLEKHLDYISGAKVIYLDDGLPEESIEFVAKNTEVPIFVSFRSDKNVQKFRSILPRIYGVGMAQSQLGELYGKPINKYKELREAAAWAVEEGVKEIFIAVATGGIYYVGEDGAGRLGGVLEDVVYWNGIGEACAAAMIQGYNESRNIRQTAIIASMHAKAVSQTFAPVNREISKETILDWIKEYFPEVYTPEEDEE